MANLEKNEVNELKEMIDKLNHQACRQILFGMADLLFYHPSIIVKIFRMYIEDGVKYSRIKEGR